MNDNETYEFESRRYINPTLSSGEQESFIKNFRDVQNKNNQQIATDTYNLGTAVPSNLGGLGGGESYFNQRYQTDQVDDMVANLDTAAKAQTLNDVMTNLQGQLKQRYTKAQQAYNRRQAKRARSSGSDLSNLLNSLFGGNGGKTANGEVDEENITGETGYLNGKLYSSPEDTDLKSGGTYSTVTGGPGSRYSYTYDSNGFITKTSDPSYIKFNDIYIPKYIYQDYMDAKTIPIIGQSAANKILENYYKSHGK